MRRPPVVTWTFHGTAAVRSYRDTLAWLDRFVGCIALEYRDSPAPISALGGCCWLGDNCIELAEPNAPGTPTAKFIERFGPGYLNLALMVDSLVVAEEWFTPLGAKPTLPPETHFTFTHPAQTCGLQLEWADFPKLHWDPRHGVPMPARTGPAPLIDAPRIGSWGAMVADPQQAVARLQEFWRAPILFENYDAPPAQPAAGLSLVDGVLALYRAPASSEEAMQLWGTSVAKPRFHLMTFRVRDLAQAEQVVRRENVRILRGSAAEGSFVTHPDDTQGLCLSWTDRELPGDPRGDLV